MSDIASAARIAMTQIETAMQAVQQARYHIAVEHDGLLTPAEQEAKLEAEHMVMDLDAERAALREDDA